MVGTITSQRALAPRVAGPASAQDDSSPDATSELRGEADGPDVQLPSGIVISLRKVGNARVSAAELQRIVASIRLLPAADQALVAQAGVRIDLLPVAALEQGISGHDELGATDLDPDGAGVMRPTGVRIAVRSDVQTGAEAPGEIVQHEIGHVVAVLEHGDRSEAAAIAYAQAY